MGYSFFASAVVVAHAAFVVFVLLGGLLVRRWRWTAAVHLPAAAWGAWVEWSRSICPLTPLENWLRVRGGGAGYQGGFVEHHLVPLLYPSSLPAGVPYAFAALVVAANIAVYGWALSRPAGGTRRA